MKKIFFLVLVFLAGALYADGPFEGSVTKDDVDPIVKKDHEIGINVFGVFIGSYTAQYEFVPAGDGLFSLGIKATLNSIKFSSTTLTGFQALGLGRLYPARYMRGFYVMAEVGYANSSVEDNGESTSVSTLPLLAGLGWKWVINEFSIDLGLAYGRHIYLNSPNSDIVDPNSYPYNIAADGHLLVGYRF